MRKRLMLPALFTAACTPMPPEQPCNVVPVLDAGRPFYQCADGRMCDAPNPNNPDVYQICPGTNECATLVSIDGGSMGGFC